MCWESRGMLNVLEAKDDVVVFKFFLRRRKNWLAPVSDKLFSPFREFEYEIGKEYTAKINPIQTIDTWRINKGIHSYDVSKILHIKINTFKTEPKFTVEVRVYDDNENDNSFYSAYEETQTKVPILMKCHIPAGTTYYVNKIGEVVSEKLVIDEEIEIPRKGPSDEFYFRYKIEYLI